MKKFLLISFVFASIVSHSQSLTDTAAPFWQQAIYPQKDTLPCHFLECINDTTFKWNTGFVVREKGYFEFDGSTKVTKEYLTITSGILKSKIFYKDMRPVKKYAIQVILKPTD